MSKENELSMEEIITRKLKQQEELTDSELEEMQWRFEEVFEEEGKDGRWSKTMKTVFKVGDDLYALEWERGLTEMQENQYFKQPYKVKLVKKEVTVTTTEIVKLEEGEK